MKNTDVLVIQFTDSKNYIIHSWKRLPKETSGINISGRVNKIICRFDSDLIVLYVLKQILRYVNLLGEYKHITAFENFMKFMAKAEYEYIDG